MTSAREVLEADLFGTVAMTQSVLPQMTVGNKHSLAA